MPAPRQGREILNAVNEITRPLMLFVRNTTASCCSTLAIGDERGRTARLRVIKVRPRPHHAAPTPITLAESSMAERLQAGRPGLQMSSLWQAELTFIRFFSDIQKNYSGYLKINIYFRYPK